MAGTTREAFPHPFANIAVPPSLEPPAGPSAPWLPPTIKLLHSHDMYRATDSDLDLQLHHRSIFKPTVLRSANCTAAAVARHR